MTAFYTKLQATALALLTKYGQTVTLRRTATGAYNPATGQAAVTPTDLPFKGALFDFEGVTQVDGNSVERGDKRLLLEGAAAPSIDDSVVVGGVTYTVLGIPKSTNPAGTAVVYELHLRK